MTTGQRFEHLLEIMTTLRAPGGCPWDREQTHLSLRPYLLEEAHEVLACLDAENLAELPGELGDLLLQVVFHATIAAEAQSFSIDTVLDAITRKLIDRHPHVFGDEKIETAEAQAANWERLKKKEGQDSALDGVPDALPALAKAQRVQQKAAAVGFDWERADEILDKLQEERTELAEAIQEGEPDRIESELGDLLFTVVNLSRFLGYNAEDALRGTCSRFSERFRNMEARVHAAGRDIHEMGADALESFWQEAKKDESAR